jgi:hypothetical protein
LRHLLRLAVDRPLHGRVEEGRLPARQSFDLGEAPFLRVGYTAGQHEVGYLLAKGTPPRPAKPLSDILPWQYTGKRIRPNEKPVCAIRLLIEAVSS